MPLPCVVLLFCQSTRCDAAFEIWCRCRTYPDRPTASHWILSLIIGFFRVKADYLSKNNRNEWMGASIPLFNLFSQCFWERCFACILRSRIPILPTLCFIYFLFSNRKLFSPFLFVSSPNIWLCLVNNSFTCITYLKDSNFGQIKSEYRHKPFGCYDLYWSRLVLSFRCMYASKLKVGDRGKVLVGRSVHSNWKELKYWNRVDKFLKQ